MKSSIFAALSAAAFLGLGCAAHTSLAPVGQGRLVPHVGIGGPLVEAFDTHIPVPYLLVGADYGLRPDVNLNTAVHLLPLAYGVAGLDGGIVWFPIDNDGWRPTIGVGPRLFAFASTKTDMDERFLVYPAVSASAAWAGGPGVFYTGADAAVPLDEPAYDDEARPILLSPFVGYRWNVGRRHALLTEVKWHGANVRTDQVVTGYTALGQHGAVTPLLALQRRF